VRRRRERINRHALLASDFTAMISAVSRESVNEFPELSEKGRDDEKAEKLKN
jgi:hypothetical protein